MTSSYGGAPDGINASLLSTLQVEEPLGNQVPIFISKGEIFSSAVNPRLWRHGMS